MPVDPKSRSIVSPDAPPAMMSWEGRLIPINSFGMREVIDAHADLKRELQMLRGTTQLRDRSDDQPLRLFYAAIHALLDALKDGEKTHAAGVWRGRDADHHLIHARDHIDAFLNGDLVDAREQSHLSHLVCRAVMAAAISGW